MPENALWVGVCAVVGGLVTAIGVLVRKLDSANERLLVEKDERRNDHATAGAAINVIGEKLGTVTGLLTTLLDRQEEDDVAAKNPAVDRRRRPRD